MQSIPIDLTKEDLNHLVGATELLIRQVMADKKMELEFLFIASDHLRNLRSRLKGAVDRAG